MKNIEGIIFDENGNPLKISNIDIFSMEMKDRLLIKTYKTTLYQHILTLEMEKLIESGLIKKIEGHNYDPQPVDLAINIMKGEIIERFDKDFFKKVYDSIDLSFLKNKPKNL